MRMPKLVTILGLGSLIVGASALRAQVSPTSLGSPPLIIDHVTVVDVEHARLLADRRVEIRDHHIAAVRGAGGQPPSRAHVVDARGKYLIPGLWDLHVHTLRDGRAAWMFPLFIANGVLGIRDTGSPLDSLLHYRRAVASGDVLGPRVVGSGPLLDGPGGQWPTFTVSVATAAEGRRAVDSLADAGVNFIKVYDRLSRDAFFAIAQEAKRRHVPVIGHVPESVTALEASTAGMRSIEHLTVGPACIPTLTRVLQDAAAQSRRPGLTPDSIRAIRTAGTLRAAAAYDESACRAAGATLARNGTWLVPTLSRERTWSHAYLASPTAGGDPNLRYVPQLVRATWDRWRDSAVTSGSAQDDTAQAAVYATYVRIVRALRGAAVGILPGTDTDGNDAYYYGVPGYTLHAELETLVRDAGFTPAEALRAATLDAARFLGASDSLGTVASRRVADLVLLDANPLTDIRNAGRIAAVVANGRYLDHSELERLLGAAR